MRKMTKYIPPRIHTVVMEDIMEDDNVVVSQNTLIENPEEVLAKPVGEDLLNGTGFDFDFEMWEDKPEKEKSTN